MKTADVIAMRPSRPTEQIFAQRTRRTAPQVYVLETSRHMRQRISLRLSTLGWLLVLASSVGAVVSWGAAVNVCRWLGHQWSKWNDCGVTVNDKPPPASAQIRQCERCGLKEVRTL